MIKGSTKIALLIMLFSLSIMAKAQDNIIDEIIWVVGDEAILKSDVEKARLDMQARGERIEGDPYCLIPEQLAVQKLYLDQAKIDSVVVSPAEVSRFVSRHEANVIANLGSKEKAEEYLGAPLTELREEWRELSRNNTMMQEAQRKIVGKKTNLSPSEVRKYYSQLPKDSLPFIPENVELQIITREPAIPLEDIDKVKETLRRFTDRVNKGETTFASLAIAYSDDKASAMSGGELGFMGRAQLLPEFANVAFSLSDPKKISNIVETEYGYHIIQLIERRGDRANFRHILLRPKMSTEIFKKSINDLDSLRKDIAAKKFSFDEATILSADKDTQKSNGIMVNRKDGSNYGTPRFTLEELPAEIAQVASKMKIGDVSEPFKMIQANGREVVAIVKLKARTEGHTANISDDYQALKEIVESKKQDDILKKWLQNKIASTYVHIDKKWCNCEYQFAGWNNKN